jgi:hypothetical protein
MDALPLRVRVGWRVRSEMVPLGQEFALAGHGRDEDCAVGGGAVGPSWLYDRLGDEA